MLHTLANDANKYHVKWCLHVKQHHEITQTPAVEDLASSGSCCSPQRIDLVLLPADGAPQQLLVLSLLLIQLTQQSESHIDSMTQQKAM